MKYNYENLTHVSPGTYTVAYSIKFMLMCLITYAHQLMYIFGYPSAVSEDLEMVTLELILCIFLDFNRLVYLEEVISIQEPTEI